MSKLATNKSQNLLFTARLSKGVLPVVSKIGSQTQDMHFATLKMKLFLPIVKTLYTYKQKKQILCYENLPLLNTVDLQKLVFISVEREFNPSHIL